MLNDEQIYEVLQLLAMQNAIQNAEIEELKQKVEQLSEAEEIYE